MDLSYDDKLQKMVSPTLKREGRVVQLQNKKNKKKQQPENM